MKDLRFYNKEGYPYNFTYDQTNEIWNGTLLFDQNGSDVYKTIGMYIFQNVDPITFSTYFNFNKLELYDKYGIIFKGATVQDYNITDIKKTNNSDSFYTKWIYGNNFHIYYPAGTLIKIKNVNVLNTSDFNNDVYYNVIGTKHNAIMIQTNTLNSLYSGVYVSGGTVSSYNVIKYPDFNQNISSMINSKLYVDKKITIVNSTKNDGVISLLDYSTYKRTIYDFNINAGLVGQKIALELTTLTDRPMLHSGTFTISGTTFIFNDPIRNDFSVGNTIIFEDLSGNQLLGGYEYTITKIRNEKYIGNFNLNFYLVDDNTVDSTEYFCSVNNTNLNLNVNDIIYFSGNTLNANKDFKILNIDTTSNSALTILQLEQLVHIESVNGIDMTQKLKYYNYNTIETDGVAFTTQTLSGIAYLTTNTLIYEQEIIQQSSGYTTYEETIKAFVNNYNTELNSYGVNSYYKNDELIIEGLYEYNIIPYFTVKLKLKDEADLYISQYVTNNTYSDYSNSTNVYYLITDTKIYNETVYFYEDNKLAQNYYEEILFNLNEDSRDYGINLNINDVEYYISYQNISGNTNTTQETINALISLYGGVLYENGIYIHSGNTVDNKLYIETLYPNIKISKLKITVNTFSTYTILNSNVNSLLVDPILLVGNQLDNVSFHSLFDFGLSTGMVISLTGNTYNENQQSYNILGLTKDRIELSYQGAFFEDTNKLVEISTREYIRKPRVSYNKDIYFKVSWINTPDNLYDDSMFFYDISGDQLTPPLDNAGNYITDLTYTGIKPLFDETQQNMVYLNKSANTNLQYVSDPAYQQTIFDNLNFLLPQLDAGDDYNYLPEPLSLFIGYNTTDEGVNSNIMIIEKVENLILSGTTGILDNYFIMLSGDTTATIIYKSNSFSGFDKYGFEVGQIVQMKFKDTSTINQTIFPNYDNYTIIGINKNILTINLSGITSTFVNFNSNDNNDTFNFSISVQPKQIAQFTIYGETEVEDDRFDINLRNLGININREEETIFSESDIEEYGIDYILLNQKRKEMLLVYPDIYNYIGSYKSLIAAINYFGYADLELYEYYRNINKNSPLYKKLFRVYIPDIFDMTTDGWTEYDYIKTKGNRNNYQKTNLFNLTYNITDTDGYNIETYSLKEVQTKLQKLKVWLRNNILPLGTNIIDITGAAKFPATSYLQSQSNQINMMQSTSSCEIVNFNYTATLSFSTNYLLNINFYTISGIVPDYYEVIVKTFSINSSGKLTPVQYFKTLKTDLNSFNISIDKNIDPYIYLEITTYNDYGTGIKNKKIFKYDEAKSYYLINNNLRYKYYPRVNTGDSSYIIDDDGQLWKVTEYSK